MRRRPPRHEERRAAAESGTRYAAFYAGDRAYKNGLSPVDCRHVLGTKEHTDWMKGWTYAREYFADE